MASNQELVLSAEDIHVEYKVFTESAFGFKELFTRGPRPRESTVVKAVQGVSLEVFEGESIGLIGSNGSGKSTLLRAISGLVPITKGEVSVRSRPTLLGVGAALRPQLSGRTNLLIGGLALGMTKAEVEAELPKMIDFSGLGDSIDRPMQTYSSGMRARLTFTVATAITPDILMIDEALAVGDRAFYEKSSERIAQIRSEAGAVVLVSHNMSEIENSCDRCYWLHKGKLMAEGETSDVIEQYHAFDLEE